MARIGQFMVNHWGSHPDAGNDDCYCGEDFETLDLAKANYSAECEDYSVAFIELNGPGIQLIRENENYDRARVARDNARDDSDWQREQAMQAGMAFGCDGYNDEMGW